MKNGMTQDLLDGDVGTLLHLFAQNGAVDSVERNIDRTSSKNYTIESKTAKFRQTALHLAAQANCDAEKIPRYVKICKTLIQAGANVNARDRDEKTPLHLAAESWKDTSEICKVLIEAGAKLEAEDFLQNSPLHLAENVKVCKTLLQLGANVNARGNNERTPLFFNVESEETLGICKALLEAGANIDAKDWYQKTPLHAAVMNTQLENVEFLLEHGAQIDPKDKNGKTPLDLAIQEIQSNPRIEAYQDVANFLMEKKREALDEIPLEKINQKACCVVCFAKRNGVFVLLPCAHASLCEPCCFRLKNEKSECPTCRSPINDYKKIYFQDPDAN